MFTFVVFVFVFVFVLVQAVRPRLAIIAVARLNNIFLMSSPPSEKNKIASLKSWRFRRLSLRRPRRRPVWLCSFVLEFCPRTSRVCPSRAFRDSQATYQVLLSPFPSLAWPCLLFHLHNALSSLN